MGKMLCRCGYLFDFTPIPQAFSWLAVKDTDRETYIQAVAETEELTKDYERNQERVTVLDQMTFAMDTQICNCPVCNRLYWFRGEDGEMEVFVPESEPPAA